MADAYRDQNNVPTLIAASSADGKTPVRVWADPSTHRLLVDLGAGVVGPGLSTDGAVVVWDGTTGETLKNSTLVVSGDDLDVPGDLTAGTVSADNGASGSFTTVDLKTVTVVNGVITSIA